MPHTAGEFAHCKARGIEKSGERPHVKNGLFSRPESHHNYEAKAGAQWTADSVNNYYCGCW